LEGSFFQARLPEHVQASVHADTPVKNVLRKGVVFMKKILSRLTAFELNLGFVTLVFDTTRTNTITGVPVKGNL
jgi:hypothetical protein